jgi:CRP-like cAMP-binding protein
MAAMSESRLSPGSLLVLWRQNPVFAALEEPDLQALVAACPPRRWLPGSAILEAGASVEHLYVVLAGTVRIFHRAPDGRQAVVKLLRAPCLFAELELLHQLPMLESVSAVDEVLLARLPAADYIALLHKVPAAMFAQLKHLAAAFCVAVRNEQQVFAPLEARIANLLLSYADLEQPDDSENTLPLVAQLSQQDIAQSLGAARRSVVRILAGFQKSRLIERSGNQWVLRDRAALEKLAEPIRHSLKYHMGMPLAPLARKPPLRRARLTISRGAPRWIGRSYEVGPELIIGRQPPARLLLPGDTVSPQHCRVFRATTGGRHWLEDLESLNGCMVNDRPVKRCVLKEGDRIRVGGFELLCELECDGEP